MNEYEHNPFVVDISAPAAPAAPAPHTTTVVPTQGPAVGSDFFPSAFEAEAGQSQPLQQQQQPLQQQPSGGGMFDMPMTGQTPETEPPLLEELEISLPHIWGKTKAVLNPMREIEPHLMDDTDLAGPLLYCLVFGVVLMLTGKMQFGYVFGLGALSCVAMWALLNMMSERGAGVSTVSSVLGYCMLPIIALALSGVFLPARLVIVRAVLAALSVAWSTYSSSLMLVRALAMVDQRLLVAYPAAMIYLCFALLTLF